MFSPTDFTENQDALTAGLNPAQHQAVTAPAQHHLVLAGAGSGKTRVLVQRMAWLVQNQKCSPYALFAVTFTNKAATEMRSRLQSNLSVNARSLWIGTFHGLAHRFLRQHWQAAGLPENFQIMDSDEQSRLIKRLIKSLQLDETRWTAKQAQNLINHWKDNGLRASMIEARDLMMQGYAQIYQAYESSCQTSGVLDFAELLLRTVESCQKNPDLLAHYQRRFQHILIDEFQDTNALQYHWLMLLSSGGAKVFAVGDDDQSIYAWRGAKVDYLLNFQRDFAGAQLTRLEQNYRSTSVILQAANHLIAKNSERMGKQLWTAGADGQAIQIYAALNEYEEADYVITRVREHLAAGGARPEIAVLYRANAQSRVLEESFLRANIPYRVYGGFRFFERQEVKDALAYLRLVYHPDDDNALERVLNLPTRGIGMTSVEKLRDIAKNQNSSLWSALQHILENTAQSRSRTIFAFRQFVSLIQTLQNNILNINNLSLDAQIEHIIEVVGLKLHYQQQEKGDAGLARIENLDELVNAARGFVRETDLPNNEHAQTFLAQSTLDSEAGQNDIKDSVQLMTLHSAKGLEFPCVLMVGMEEGVFPTGRAIEDEDLLQEERRLCYVGITRAEKQLHLCWAQNRRLYGKETYSRASRFIEELPHETVHHIRPTTHISLPINHRFSQHTTPPVHSNHTANIAPKTAQTHTQTSHTGEWKLHDKVRHAKFGEGKITGFDGEGARQSVIVEFRLVGRKQLALSVVKLERI